MNLFSIIINIIAIIVLLWYFYIKYQKRGYFISAFNLQLFKYSFILLIMPYVFANEDRAWYAVGIYSANSMRVWLNEDVKINTIGFIIMMASLMFFEFRSDKSTWIEKKVSTIAYKINDSLVDILFMIIIPLWYFLVFKINGALPLFDNSRTFFYNTGFSSIYQGLNELIQLFALHYGLNYILHRKGLIFFILALFTMICTANRGPVLLNVLAPMLIIHIYSTALHFDHNGIRIRQIREIRKSSFNVFKVIPIIIICGIFLGVLRAGREFHISEMVVEILYGNNFCDIRDGAKILNKANSIGVGFLGGKTILAGVFSIIPSSVFPFKEKWAFGRFTTTYLFGMTNHFGMRGGNSLESYLNFGYLGVIISAICQGYLYAVLERIFYSKFLLYKEQLCGNEYFIILAIMGLRESFSISTALSTTYIDILFLIFLLLSSNTMRRKLHT